MIIIIYFLFLCLNHISYGMEKTLSASYFKKTMPPLLYLPYQIDPRLNEWRKQLNLKKEIAKQNPDFKCIAMVSDQKSLEYRCFQYALEQITGFNEYIPFPSPDSLTIYLRCFFKQTAFIQKNNLLVYTTNGKEPTIKHFAVAISHEKAQSKCGAYPEIIEHTFDALFLEYGTLYWSLCLKQKYQKNRQLLLHDIAKNLQQVRTCYNNFRLHICDNPTQKPKKEKKYYQDRKKRKLHS